MSASKQASDEVQWAEARRWFAKADEDLRAAEALIAITPPATGAAAFHCQQAAEKVFKGLLIAVRQKAERTHDLSDLGANVAKEFPGLLVAIEPIVELTPWFVATRYPDIDIAPQPGAPDVAAALQRLRVLPTKAAALDPTGYNPPADAP